MSESGRQEPGKSPESKSKLRRSFRKALGLGAVWLLVVSSVAVGHNRTRPPGIISGELLGTNLIAVIVNGTVGQLLRISPLSHRGFSVRMVCRKV
jgi:hypothetical protein